MAGISTRLGFHSKAQKKAIHLFKFGDISVANFSNGSGNGDTIFLVQLGVQKNFLFVFRIADTRFTSVPLRNLRHLDIAG